MTLTPITGYYQKKTNLGRVMKKTLSIEAVHSLYAGELGHALAQIENTTERFKAQSECDDEGGSQEKPYSVIDGIAIYKISGPLLTSGNRWSRLLGYAAYDDIRADLTQVANDPDVQEILCYMGTPGGAVYGVTDVSDAMAKIGAIKPLYVYSQKNVASGGYWLAANATTLIGSPESEWGSIGVIVTHFSYEKQLEEDGITVTIIKSDELKAVGGPYKDLTEKEVSHIKSQVDQYNDLFQEHVRSKRPGVRLASMKGETYIGEDALRMGLIDAVMSYDQTIDYIKSKRKMTTQTGGYKMKMTAEELKTALDSGATLESLGLTAEDVAEIQASVQEAEPEAYTETTVEAEVSVDVLKELVAVKDVEITELAAKVEQLTAELATTNTDKALVAEMKSVISEVMCNRRVALGLPKIDFSAFSAESLMSDYKAITDQFDKAFKTGGMFSKKEEVKKPAVADNRNHAALLDAAA